MRRTRRSRSPLPGLLGEGRYKMRDEQPSPISEEEFARRFPRIMSYWGGMPGSPVK